MRRLTLLVPMFVLAAACGSPVGSGGPRAQPPRSPRPDDPVSSSPIPPLNEIPGPGYETVVPRPGMENVMARPFERVEGTGQTLTVIFWSGVEPCNVLDHVDVEETARAVTITLYEGFDPEAGKDVACIEIAVKKATEVQLDEPLGDRKVKDGAL